MIIWKKRKKVWKRVLRNSAGFSMVGVLVASTIGVVVVIGLTNLSMNVINTMQQSSRENQLITLQRELRDLFSSGPLSDCVSPDCYNSCTNSLRGYKDIAGTQEYLEIKSASSAASPFGRSLYKGGYTDRFQNKINQIKFLATSTRDSEGSVIVDFAPGGDDTKRALSSSISVEFKIKIIDYMGPSPDNRIKSCQVIGGNASFSDNCLVVDCAESDPLQAINIASGADCGHSGVFSRKVFKNFTAGGGALTGCGPVCVKNKTDCSLGILSCISGETRPPECNGKINYTFGTWGGETSTYGTEVGIYCYKPGQKRDNDATDKTVGYLCKTTP